MERAEFLVAGSQGDEYTVIFEVSGALPMRLWTCPAGSNGQFCKHRMRLMGGEISQLRNGTTADVARLKTLLQGTGLEAAYDRVLEAEEEYAKAKAKLDAAKRDLSRAARQ